MESQLIYHWKYNGVGHAEAAERILVQADVESKMVEFSKYYSILSVMGRIYTHLPDGTEDIKIHCSCQTCTANSSNAQTKEIYETVYNSEISRIQQQLDDAPDFSAKTRIWLREGLSPLASYGSEDIRLSLIPKDASQNELYNRFIIDYLLQSDEAYVKKERLGARIADFEARTSRALYPKQVLEDTKARLFETIGKHSNKTVRDTFNDLVAGQQVNYTTVPWISTLGTYILIANGLRTLSKSRSQHL